MGEYTAVNRATRLPVGRGDADGCFLRLLYRSAAGRALASAVLRRGMLRVASGVADSRMSRAFIKGFAKKRGIAVESDYESFNDFFSRDWNGTLPAPSDCLLSPCEAYVSAWADSSRAGAMLIKERLMTLDELIEGDASRWRGGALYRLSLTTSHIHRIIAFDDCSIISEKSIGGAYHSTHEAVREYAPDVYFGNYRLAQTLNTKRFGTVLCVAVASMLVGSVRRAHPLDEEILRGETLDRFCIGGSAVLLAFERGAAAPDDDLLQITESGHSAEVSIGERIGRLIPSARG